MRLEVSELTGERGGDAVFSGVNFVLDSGAALLVTGPNGAGKSTLLRVLAGLLPVASGSIDFVGEGEFSRLGAALHYLGHGNSMKTALSVAENLAFWQSFAGAPYLGVAEALDEVGLDGLGHLPFGYLSTGQKRRVAIARLLINYRPVWLLDEPTAGLDRASEAHFAALMRAHLEDGGMIVAATHLPLGLDGATTLEMGRPFAVEQAG